MMHEHEITIGELTVQVVRKDIKNVHLAVYPPNGRVRVAVPERIDDDAVRLAVISKLPWIRTQQAKFHSQDRQTEREYVSGESHYVQGRRYVLRVDEQDAPPTVSIQNPNTLVLTVRPGSDREKRATVVTEWYRERLKADIPPLIAKWEAIMPVEVAEWRVRQMRTKWGTCTIERQRIWLNLELAKKPYECLEYIIVHEMVHLMERHHNARFIALMDAFLPDWRARRDTLNHAPLAYEDWEY